MRATDEINKLAMLPDLTRTRSRFQRPASRSSPVFRLPPSDFSPNATSSGLPFFVSLRMASWIRIPDLIRTFSDITRTQPPFFRTPAGHIWDTFRTRFRTSQNIATSVFSNTYDLATRRGFLRTRYTSDYIPLRASAVSPQPRLRPTPRTRRRLHAPPSACIMPAASKGGHSARRRIRPSWAVPAGLQSPASPVHRPAEVRHGT